MDNLTLMVSLSTGKSMVLELKTIYEAETRVSEVATVTKGKAPELMATFNRIYGKLHDMIFDLNSEKIWAEKKLSEIKSVIIIDDIPRILREKGLGNSRSPLGSEDLREAILAQNAEYQNALATVKQIECVTELLLGKMKSIQMAYQSVKKVYDDHSVLNRDINDNTEERHNSGFNDRVRF